MTRLRLISFLLFVAVVAYIGCYLFVLPLLNPLRRSADQITASMLEQTPVGTTQEEVKAVIRARGWPVGGDVINDPSALSEFIGHYDYFGFDVEVFACWRFDERGRLRRLEVSKGVSNFL